MKKNKNIINFSKRRFNIYVLLSVSLCLVPKKSVSLKNDPIKKIKYNNFVWYLNEKD